MIKSIAHTKNELLNSLLAGNRANCSILIHEQLNRNMPFKVLYENIIRTALYEIGELWEYNKISVATEHLASAIIEATINEIYPSIISKEKNKKKVIVSCVEKEFHQIGIKMVSDVFESNGWNSYFLGANTPTEDLVSYARTINPDIFSISLSLYFHLPTLETMIDKVRLEFPDLPILVGGQAFLKGGQNIISKYSNINYLPDLNDLDLFIKNV